MFNKLDKLKLYFASPLFNNAELEFNYKFVNMLEPYFDVFLPQRDGGLLSDKIVNGENPISTAMHVFNCDIQAMNQCDILFAILDGRTVDEGVAFEIGYSFGKGKECVGFKSDNRTLLPSGNNPMIDQSLKMIFCDFESTLKWAKKFTTKRSVVRERTE